MNLILSPLRIALVHVADQGGGAERSVLTLHKTLLEMGHDSRLYVGTKHTDEPSVVEIPRIRTVPGLMRLVYWLERRGGWHYLYSPRLRRLPEFFDVKPDVVHIHTLWGGQYGYADVGALPRLARLFPIVLTLRDSWILTGHCASPIRCDRWKTGCGRCPDLTIPPAISRDATRCNWRRKRAALRRSRPVITTVSHWLKGQAQRSPILADKRIEVVHNSVNERMFSPGDSTSARHRLGLPVDTPLALLVTKNNATVDRRGMKDAVTALNGLTHEGLAVAVVGRASDRAKQQLSGRAFDLGLQSGEESMATCYRAATFTIVPSEFETFGRVPVEAQMCGTPVIAYRTGGLAEVVAEEAGCVLVSPGDVNALREAVRNWIDQPQRIESIRKRCVGWAVSRFSSVKIAERYLRLYRTLTPNSSAAWDAA